MINQKKPSRELDQGGCLITEIDSIGGQMVSRAELSLSCAELLPPIGGSSILEGSSSIVVVAY